MGNKTEVESRKKVSQRFHIQKLDTPDCLSMGSYQDLQNEVKCKEISHPSPLEGVSDFVLPERWLSQKRRDESEIDSDSQGSKQSQHLNIGRWTETEHKKFLEAILLYGNEWKKVQQYISTRSSTQARSHAQKFFLRLKKNISVSAGFEQEHIDFFKALGENKKSKFFLTKAQKFISMIQF